jgi:hypothetical protein
MTKVECPTATAAFFLPMRRASRQYWPPLVPLVQFDHVARRVDHDRLVSESLPVRDVVHGVPVRADALDGRREIVNLDREVRRVCCAVRRLEEVNLPVIQLKPRAGVVRASRPFDNRQAENISVEGQRFVGVANDEGDVMNASATWFHHGGMVPDADSRDQCAVAPIGGTEDRPAAMRATRRRGE